MTSGRLLTLDDAAARMNVSLRTVRRLVARRALASVRIGRLVRVPEEGVDAFIAASLRPAVTTVEVGTRVQIRPAAAVRERGIELLDLTADPQVRRR